LNVATQNGYKEIVELLITNGAEVNAISTMKTMKGVLQIGTTLDEAIKRNRPEIIDLLRKHGGKTGDWLNADKSIHDAAFDGNIEAIKQHLAAGTNVNAKDDNGRTPLLLAVEESHKEIAELLILKGANVNAKNQNEVTPLHWAAARGHKEIVELLIAKGADVNAKSDDGTTPLHFNNKEVVELLIAASADVNAKDDDSLTPLDWAVDEDSTETAALLRKHGGKTGEELKAAGK
jgi:cytohesin